MFRRVPLTAVLLALGLPFQAHAQAAATPSFDVWEFQVEGVSLLPDEVVEEAVYPSLGEGKTLADVEQARQRLEKAFHDAGYQTVLVDIPEQAVGFGLLRLRVIEAPLERVRVVGARYHDPERVLAEAPSLAEGQVPHFPSVQEDLARLNRMPGRRVTPVLKPGRQPGTTDMDLNVEDRAPWGAKLSLSNDHSAETEPLRLTASVHHDNLFQRLHGITLQYQTSPQDTDQVRAFTASYLVPLWQPGEFLSLYAARSESGVAVLDTTSALGNGTVYGLRWIKPLPGREGLNHSLTLGVDYKDFTEQLVQTGSEPIDTPVRYWPFSANYSGSLRDGSGAWNYSTGLTWGFRGLGGAEDSFGGKRYLARGNFFIFKWDLQRSQDLGDWGTVVAGVDGQIADQPLVSNEQYAAGGMDSVRGYLQAEALGDNALRGSLEWRSPSLAQGWLGKGDDLRAFAFLEGARVKRKEPLPAETAAQNLSSAGVGLRLRALDALAVDLNVGWPFKDSDNGSDSATRAHEPRVQFSTAVEF